MIKKILIVPRIAIERSLENAQRLSEIDGTWALISIYTEKVVLDIKELGILKSLDCEDYLSLRFADITKTDYDSLKYYKENNLTLFTKKQAVEIINFLNRVQENDKIETLVIHCTAGISRSGACGVFACRYLHTDNKNFWRTNPHIYPNEHVLQLLMEASGLRDDYVKCWKSFKVDPENIF